MSNSNYKNNAESFSIQQIVKGGALLEIPPYQRLYEWEKEQIETLLEDCRKACFNAEGGLQDKIYFIGNVVVSKQEKENERKYILIDGQQRLTTLFLIGVYLATRSEIEDNPWKGFIKNDKQIRISMPLRENEEKWLLDFISKNDRNFKKIFEKNPNIHHKITKGLKTISQWFEDNIKDNITDLTNFSSFLYGIKVQDTQKEVGVRFALVELAKDTDLNQFFVRMNNRGKQLEKHEILKSRLLDIIRGGEGGSGEWQKYAKIWDLCSDMDKYLFALEEDRKIFELEEQEGDKTVRKTLQDMCDKKLYNIALKFKNNINELDADKKNSVDMNNATKLAEIIKESNSQPNEKKTKDATYHSIIDFPTFLLHVFKLFALRNDQGFNIPINFCVPIKKDDLLKTMWDDRDEANFWNEDKARAFIQQLLLYRFAFDYFVIKQKAGDSSYVIDWSYIEGEKSNRKLFGIRNGDDDLKNLVMIQNYLRVARAGERQNYHHWLTYMLKKAYEILFNDRNGLQNDNGKVKENIRNIVKNLENLDTKLAYQQVGNKTESDLLMIANQELEGGQSNNAIGEDEFGFLNQGTGTPHYWFYRLEYYLWKDRENRKIEIQIDGVKTINFKTIAEKYRFRGLNSVEHIQPQSKEEEWIKWKQKNGNVDQNKICKINDFGNLALISQNFNSSLNNQSMEKKWIDIKNKEDVESLKMCLAYASVEGKYQEWNPTTAKEHQDEMLEVLKASLKDKGQK